MCEPSFIFLGHWSIIEVRLESMTEGGRCGSFLRYELPKKTSASLQWNIHDCKHAKKLFFSLSKWQKGRFTLWTLFQQCVPNTRTNKLSLLLFLRPFWDTLFYLSARPNFFHLYLKLGELGEKFSFFLSQGNGQNSHGTCGTTHVRIRGSVSVSQFQKRHDFIPFRCKYESGG